MRKYLTLFLFCAIAALAGCANPVIPTAKTPNVWVVNSAWEVVNEYVYTGARAIQSLDAIESEVDQYNATHSDDQLEIITDESDLDIAEAPNAILTIIFADNNEVYATSTVARADLEHERAIYRAEIQTLKFNSGRPTALYVDNDPPAYTPPYVEPVDNRPNYEKYCFYIIDADGKILFEEHTPEGQDLIDYFMGDTTKTCKDWWDSRMAGIRPNWRNEFPTATQLIEGRIYTEPVPEEPEA